MTITFNKHDRELVAKKLEDMGLYASDQRINDVLHNVHTAFLQQFNDETDYMIDEIETS